MEWPLFDRIARELGELGYAGWLAFHHCREPLLNPRLVREVEHVRQLVPAARPAIHTDGELLTPPLLVDLLRLGSGHVRVTRWPRDGDAGVDHEPIRQWLLSGGLLDALPWRFQEESHGWVAVYERDNLRIDVVRPRSSRSPRRWAPPRVSTCWRGRTSEACHPDGDVASIDCSGRVATCRGVFGDETSCGRHTIGNLREQTFADLWSSPTIAIRH